MSGKISTESYCIDEFMELADRVAKLSDRLYKIEDSLCTKKTEELEEEPVETFATIVETYEFEKCWVETNRFKDKDEIAWLRFNDKQTDSKIIDVDNLDWLNENVIYENFKEDGINTNIIPNILYAIKDTNNKIKNNE